MVLTVAAKDFRSPLIRNEIWVNLAHQWVALFDLPFVNLGIRSKRNAIEYLIDMPSWDRARAVLEARITENPRVLADVIVGSEQWGEELNAFTRPALTADFASWAADKLCAFYNEFARLQTREYAIGVLLPLIDFLGESFLERYVREYLAARLPEARVPRAFELLTTPVKNSFAMDQEDALLELARDAFAVSGVRELLETHEPKQIVETLHREHPKLAAKLAAHAAHFGWVYFVYVGPAFGDVQFAEFLKDLALKKTNPVAEKQKRADARVTLLAERDALLEELKPTEKDRSLLLLASEFVWAKPRRKDYQSKSYFHMERFFSELARRTGITLELARSATQQQIEAALRFGHVSQAQLQAQFEDHLVVGGDARASVLTGDALSERLSGVADPHAATAKTKRLDVLKGSCACPGAAKGKAKIVNNPDDISKMQYGDILVLSLIHI